MRNLIYSTNITIDGYCDHTLFMPDEELMGYFTGLMQNAGLLVYGRVTYELMVPYWPDVAKEQSGTKAENEFAQALADADKVVFSHTLQHAGENTRILRGSLGEEIRTLKQQPGKNILAGGVDLPSQLIGLDLIDEFYFVVHPVIAGKGRRLSVDGLQDKLNLKRVESRNFKSGCTALHYIKQG